MLWEQAKWEWERLSGNVPAHEVEVHLRKHRKCAAARRLECTQQPEWERTKWEWDRPSGSTPEWEHP